jgi:hypothetical protein
MAKVLIQLELKLVYEINCKETNRLRKYELAHNNLENIPGDMNINIINKFSVR